MSTRPTYRVAPIEEQTVLITGGTSGIGLATARRLASAGARCVILGGRDETRGRAAASAVEAAGSGTRAVFVAGDIADPATSKRLVEVVDAETDGLDSLVTCAGGDHPPRLLKDATPESAELIVRQWLLGTIYCVSAMLPLLTRRGGGSIVTVASDAGKVATPGEAVIGAAMAGIVMFTRTLALEAARAGIRANCLTPSIVQGTHTYEMVMSDPFGIRLFGKAHDRAKLGVSTPEDQAALVLFLLGPDSARLTGQAISANGGISAA